ncbi:restriction endonuclease subunit S [Persephonella sp. IF05-L8]|uniref:restriction endonuclease subunit S n=1 Tax=Persephonella sp. IF05-L8 TaxID=1158338 RepID=UPI00068E852C
MENIQNTNYKKTEIGLIPEDWEVVRLGNYIELSKEKNENNAQYPVYTVSNKYGFILSNEFFDKKVYSKNLSTYKIVKENYIAYNPYRINVGSIALFRKDIGLVSPAYIVFKANSNKIYPEFLLLLMKTDKYTHEIKRFSMSRGSVRRSLSFKDLSDFKIPLPLLPEQKAIATVLDKVRQVIEQTEEVIQANKELKKSLMKHLFTYGVVPPEETDKVKLKETEIGLIPEYWEIEKLEDLISLIQYGLSIRSSKEGKYPILKMNNLIDGKVKIYNDKLQFVDLDDEVFKKFKLKKNDILFNRTNSFELVGKAAIYQLKGDYVFASYLIRIRTIENKIYPEFLNFYLNWEKTQHRLKSLASRGVSQSNISASKLKQFKIPLPPIDEQKQIAEILSKIDQKIEAEENKKEALEKLFKSLLNNLMTGKIRINKSFTGKFERKEIHQKMEELSKKLSEDKEYLEEIKEF